MKYKESNSGIYSPLYYLIIIFVFCRISFIMFREDEIFR